MKPPLHCGKKKRQTDRSRTAAQTRYLSSPAAATLHGKTQGFVLRLPPQNRALATSCSHSTMQPSEGTDSKTPYNYARTSTPKAAGSHHYTAARKRRQTDRSRTRRTDEVPFIAGCSHFTRKNTRFRAPASSPNTEPMQHHDAAIPMRSEGNQIPKHPITMHTQAHPKQLEATVTMRQKKGKPTAAATAAQTRYLSSPAAATLHGKTQGFVLRLPPQNRTLATSCTASLPHPLPIVTTSLLHHFPSSPLPIVTTSLRPLPFLTTSLPHHFPSSPLPSSPLAFIITSLRHHFPSSPLPIVTTSLPHHFPSSPPPIVPTCLPHSLSSSLPSVTTSLRHHFPSSPLPFVTTSLPHHFPSSPLPVITTSRHHHFPSSPLPFFTTSLPHHFPSSPLPFVTTSLRHHFPCVTTSLHQGHFPSSPLPFFTTSLPHHFPSSCTPLHHHFPSSLPPCVIASILLLCIVTLSCDLPPIIKVNSIASYSFVMYC